MTYTAHPETTGHLSDTTWHVITTIVAVIGVVAAGLGAWIEYGPADATMSIFSWSWAVSDLSDLWAPLLMIGGGLLATLSMGFESIRDYEHDTTSRWIVGLEALVALAGIAALVIGVVLLF